jgi:hypothetical protein
MGLPDIVCAFFVSLGERPGSDEELFARLGFALGANRFGAEHPTGRKVVELRDHACAQIFLLASSVAAPPSAPEELPLERDPRLPLARAIRDGASRARADVAVLATHGAPPDDDRYWMILAGDATALALERFGLLYLDDRLVADWSPEPHVLDRDELPGGPGRTWFAGRGAGRWH